MALKPRFKRRILWTLTGIIGISALGVVIVPPMINLNKLKPKIQSAILQQTGIDATISGDVHFSLLGHATIVAHDVTIPMGKINNVAFRVPLKNIFDIENAPLSGDISIHGGKLQIDSLSPLPLNHDIEIYDTTAQFLGHDYTVVRGTLSDGGITGTIRTDQHKYDIDFSDNEFYIHNQNDNLEIYGGLYGDGTARGRMAIDTNDINRWFEFTTPKIPGRVRMTANFDWDGKYGFAFSDIYANDNITGNINLEPNGTRIIQLRATDLNFDFSFLTTPSALFQNIILDLDLYGDMTFGKYDFHHLLARAIGNPNELKIEEIVADNLSLTGGTIDKNGAHNITIQMPYEGRPATCVFSGTPENWQCTQFTWGNIYGSISVHGDTFDVTVISPDNMPDNDTIARHLANLGRRGRVAFTFADIGGTVTIDKRNTTPKYEFARNKTLKWLNPNFHFLPDFMTHEIGNFIWRGDTMDFSPRSGQWFLSLSGNRFYMSGKNIKDLFPDLDLQSVNDIEYTISGAYNKNNISDLSIEIAGQKFTGTMTDNALRLTTGLLNLDAFINQKFIDNYDELQFLANSPIVIPFEIKSNVFISADNVIYNGDEYQNFTYSLKPNVQALSITDNARGNLLAIIEKNKDAYDISIQVNRFVTTGPLLSPTMPLNLQDVTITADINLKTHGMIAHDLAYNMAGTIDMTIDAGFISGIGIDDFYASAENITTFNAEYALANALESGTTQLKSAHIIGTYSDSVFQTTEPATLQIRHTDAIGMIDIRNGQMNAVFDITMRGTAPTPAPIQLDIAPDGSRGYSLSEIMSNFDAAYMRAFIKTHNRF
ncbi:MAG: hypothetical protein NC311_02900 [Muribaculaceae bacterium]|nr:hypothetical protein [Muribaculaceae bacterium]